MDYSKMKQHEFDSILSDIVKENASILLSIPGVYEAVSEHFNNEVLDRWYLSMTDQSNDDELK